MSPYDKMMEEVLAEKRGSIEGMERQLEDRNRKKYSWLEQINLAPAAAFVDSVTGSRLSQAAPQQTPFEKEQMVINKLQKAIQEGQGEYANTALNFFKNKAYMDQVEAQRANAQDRLAFDKWYKGELLKDADLDRDQAGKLASLKAEKEKGGKLLTASAGEQLSDLKTQLGNVDSIFDDWNSKFGGVNGAFEYAGNWAAGYVPNSDTQKYWDNLKQKAQLIGKALEGGKLTDVDYEKYIKFLPLPTDSQERARMRVNNLRAALANKYNDRIKTFGDIGYSTGNLRAVPVDAVPPDMVMVSNGEETIYIPADELAAAEADGFKRVE